MGRFEEVWKILVLFLKIRAKIHQINLEGKNIVFLRKLNENIVFNKKLHF